MFAANPGIGNTRSAKSSRSYLTFRDATQFGVSFPCQEIAGDYPDEAKQYVVGIPIQEGTLHEGAIPSSGIFSAPEMEFHPPLELLDGIESGTLHFDADGVLQGSRLRGAWLRDGKGEKACFLLAAYGWSPLAMAFRLLPGTYLVGLALFLLLGFLLWLALRRSLVRPLKAWDAALGDTLLAVSPEEFDYACRYRELRDLAALYLLRRQMQEASSQKPSTEEVDPVSTMDTALRKLLPLIDACRLDPATDYQTEGIVAASPKALEDALLSLIREALPYGEQDENFPMGNRMKSWSCGSRKEKASFWRKRRSEQRSFVLEPTRPSGRAFTACRGEATRRGPSCARQLRDCPVPFVLCARPAAVSV